MRALTYQQFDPLRNSKFEWIIYQGGGGAVEGMVWLEEVDNWGCVLRLYLRFLLLLPIHHELNSLSSILLPLP